MRLSVILVIASASLAGGCASIVNGTSQVITVETHQNSTPVQGASCEMSNSKGTYYVTTPGTVTIHRAYGDLSINCTKEGMPDGKATVASTTKAMAFGNLLFGGAIGVVVDTTSGAAYDYPEIVRLFMGVSTAINGIDSIPASDPVSPAVTKPFLAEKLPAATATTTLAAVPATAATAVSAPVVAPAATPATTAAQQSPASINDLRYLLPQR